MAKSLAQIRAEIDRLQRSVDVVIATLKQQIAHHGLTVEDLFGSASAALAVAPVRAVPTKIKARNAPKLAAARAPKFGDAVGNVWGGMGKRPAWLVAAMAAGKTKESFLLSAAKPPGVRAVPAAPTPTPKSAVAKAVSVKGASTPLKTKPAASAPAKTVATVKAAAAAKKPAAKKAAPVAKPMAKPVAAAKTAAVSVKASPAPSAPATEAAPAS